MSSIDLTSQLFDSVNEDELPLSSHNAGHHQHQPPNKIGDPPSHTKANYKGIQKVLRKKNKPRKLLPLPLHHESHHQLPSIRESSSPTRRPRRGIYRSMKIRSTEDYNDLHSSNGQDNDSLDNTNDYNDNNSIESHSIQGLAPPPLYGGGSIGGTSTGGRSLASSQLSRSLAESVGNVFKDILDVRHQQQEHAKSISYFTSKVSTPIDLLYPAANNKQQMNSNSNSNSSSNSTALLNEFIDDLSTTEQASQSTSWLSSYQSFGAENNPYLNDINKSFLKESSHFGSLAIYLQTRFIEMKNYERNSSVKNPLMPSRFKAAVCGELFTQLFQYLERYTSFIEPILWELLNCIFVDFVHARSFQSPSASDNTKQRANNSQKKHKILDTKQIFQELCVSKTYFEKCHDLQIELDYLHAEMSVVSKGFRMKEVVKKFQTVKLAFPNMDLFIRDACFKVWRRCTVERNQRRLIAYQRSLRYRWITWRHYLALHAQREYFEEQEDRLDEASHLIHSQVTVDSTRYLPSQQSIMEKMRLKKSQITGLIITNPSPSNYSQSSTPMIGQQQQQQSTSGSSTSRHNLVRINTTANNSSGSSASSSVASTPAHKDVILTVTERTTATTEGGIVGEDGIEHSENNNTGGGERRNSLPSLQVHIANDQLHHVGRKSVIQQMRNNGLKSYTATVQVTDSSTQTQFYSPNSRQTPHSKSNNRYVAGNLKKKQEVYHVEYNAEYIPKLSSQAILYQIAFIYEQKIVEAIYTMGDPNFFELINLLQFTHQVTSKRYREKNPIQQQYDDLYHAIVLYSQDSLQIRIFAKLCGITNENDDNLIPYSPLTANFFFRMVVLLFDCQLDKFLDAFHYNVVERAVALEKLPEIFAFIEEENKFYTTLVSHIVDMPNRPAAVSTKIEFDQLLEFLMTYAEHEVSEGREIFAPPLEAY